MAAERMQRKRRNDLAAFEWRLGILRNSRANPVRKGKYKASRQTKASLALAASDSGKEMVAIGPRECTPRRQAIKIPRSSCKTGEKNVPEDGALRHSLLSSTLWLAVRS